jgi:hypothetical protein
MSARVGHALEHGGNVAMKRVAIGGGEAREGEREVHCWPNKLERNRSILYHAGSKTPKMTRTKEKTTAK